MRAMIPGLHGWRWRQRFPVALWVLADVLLVLILLGACSLPRPVDREVLHRERCLDKGYQPGTDAFRTCTLLLEMYGEEQWRQRQVEIEERRRWRDENL